MLGFQGGVSIPLVKGGVKAPPAKRQCRAGPKAVARRGFTWGADSSSHCLAMSPYCAPGGSATVPGLGHRDPATYRARARRLFFGHQGPVAAAQCPRSTHTRAAGPVSVWDSGHVVTL